jgi:hypothetical protein
MSMPCHGMDGLVNFGDDQGYHLLSLVLGKVQRVQGSGFDEQSMMV